jgi:hypothetical protein
MHGCRNKIYQISSGPLVNLYSTKFLDLPLDLSNYRSTLKFAPPNSTFDRARKNIHYATIRPTSNSTRVGKVSTMPLLDQLQQRSVFTTGISSFAVCLRHTAKAILHSANALPSVTLGKERSANCTSATASLPSTFCRVAECQMALGKEKSPSRRQVTVTDPLPSAFCGTRQRGQFCRVFAREALGKD